MKSQSPELFQREYKHLNKLVNTEYGKGIQQRDESAENNQREILEMKISINKKLQWKLQQ